MKEHRASEGCKGFRVTAAELPSRAPARAGVGGGGAEAMNSRGHSLTCYNHCQVPYPSSMAVSVSRAREGVEALRLGSRHGT